LVDSLFPVGAFAYSDGLESAAASGLLRDGRGLALWLDHYVDAAFEPCEGLALVQCARAAKRADWDAIRTVDDELTALKPSESVRGSSRAVGKRLLAAYRGLLSPAEAETFAPRAAALPERNAPAAYGVVFAHRGVGPDAAALAFGYARLAGIVSAGMRTIALGQSEGQALLSAALDRLCGAAERVLRSDPLRPEPLGSFAPMLDIQQMNHRYVYSRLFRS
jgi:urease accessory protein